MTDAQKALLREQVARRRAAADAYKREDGILQAMLVLHDARFGDPQSGLKFDAEALVIIERQSPKDHSDAE